jgi:hypothetical protein
MSGPGTIGEPLKRVYQKKDALGEQNTQLFNKISDDILKSPKHIWWFFATLILAALALLFAGNSIGRTAGRAIFETGLVVFYFSLSYLFLAFRNRKTRGRVFASALYADACEREIQHRLQIEQVISGGKILGVLRQLNVKRGDHVKIMWSFFYREEHTAGLIDQCLQDNLRVQLILVKPVGYGLELRMQDLKGHYVKEEKSQLGVSYKEVSLDNLNFLKDVLNAAEHNKKILDLIDVRFVDQYVGRPLVIVDSEKTWKSKLLNLCSSLILIFGRNFVPYSEKTIRSILGIYLAREASKYPFIVYYPETSYANSQVITGDLVDFFNMYWEAGTNPFLGPDSTLHQKLVLRPDITEHEKPAEPGSTAHERPAEEVSLKDLRDYMTKWEERIEEEIAKKYGDQKERE